MSVGIIDYGVGNLGSILGAMKRIGVAAKIIDEVGMASDCSKLILPGVGNFSECKFQLDKRGWTEALKASVCYEKKPLLGICVGMQLMFTRGTEGAVGRTYTEGLGFFNGTVDFLPSLGFKMKVPHVGWNSILTKQNSELLTGVESETDFYFVHSYAACPDDADIIIATCEYGVTFPVAFNYENCWGVQFHPEKSSKAGLKILENFSGAVGA